MIIVGGSPVTQWKSAPTAILVGPELDSRWGVGKLHDHMIYLLTRGVNEEKIAARLQLINLKLGRRIKED